MIDLAYFHPLIVHAPLVLLPVAIGFAIANLLVPRSGLRLAALLLLFLGTVGAFLATQTGEAAEHAARQTTPGVRQITVGGSIPQAIGDGSLLETHQTLGDLTANLYAALFAVDVVVWFTTAEATKT